MSGNLLSLLGLIIAVVLGASAAGWAVLKANLASQTIVLLQANVEAQKDRADEAERREQDLKQKIAALEIRVTAAEEMASGTKAIAALSQVLQAHHIELLSAIKGARP